MPSESARRPTAVLVHGAWADGSSWRPVISVLQDRAVDVVAVQNPTTSLAADVAVTRRAIDALDGPVVLVGHSWGGTVITEAGNHPNVVGLVYVAAFAPEAGQSSLEQGSPYPPAPAVGEIQADRNGDLMMSTRGWIDHVAQDLPEKEARMFAAIAPPLGPTAFADKVSTPAWARRPSWYVVSLQDQALSVALQRDAAARMKSRIVEIDASHMSIVSDAPAVANAICNAVESLG